MQALGDKLSVERDAIFNLLKQLAEDNESHFRGCKSSMYASYAVRISECCHEIFLSVDIIRGLVQQLQEAATKYDYDENTPGNGFRSLVCISDVVLLRLISTLRTCSDNRNTMMFRVYHYCKLIEAFGAILRFLTLAFHQVIAMLSMLDQDSLFPPLGGDYEQFNGIMKGIESLDASCFYGRLLGFQFSPSVTKIFSFIGVALATYSLMFDPHSASIESLIKSGTMLLNPEQRATRIIKVTREADIQFCRGFWNLSELPSSKLFCPSMALCENREIAPSGPLQLEAIDGSEISVPVPSAHTGVCPIKMKVLSVSHRSGLSAPRQLPPSSRLVIHCHGGGYVATSSKSHETYLRGWAKSLNCPVVSIDYSLAPENPFPRATEEVLYAYAWILKNPEKLGWTGDKICMVGDSAGGNLIVSVNLRLIELGAKRLPDGIVPIYTPSCSNICRRLLVCAAAYTGSYSDEELDKHCFTQDPAANVSSQPSLVECFDKLQCMEPEIIEDANANDTTQTIRVDGDNSHICLASSNFDQYLVDYLQTHPVTKRFIHRSTANDSSAEVEDLCSENSLEEDYFDGMDGPERRSSLVSTSTGAGRKCSAVSSPASTKSLGEYYKPQGKSARRRLTHSAGRVTELQKKQLRPKTRSLSQSFADTAALTAGHVYDNISDWLDTPKTPVGYADKYKLERAVTMSSERVAQIQLEEAEKHESHFTELLKLKLPRDYLMSPLYAPDELLQKLPPVRFVACHLDPLLDDTIMFAKKMRDAGGPVKSVDLLDSLPHGFLNFTPMSVDCQKGANLCLLRINETLQ
uniref:Hormone-sensitive lipase n=1 Tax=Ditylenchus dipsaci TaxID=166011 RepID=A0A915DPR8_9BILA